MVTHINSAADQLPALRVGTCNEQVLRAHHIPLETSRNEPVDVFSHRHKNFARKVATLLSAMHLILEVDGRGTILRKELSQLQHGGQSTMSSTLLAN